MYIEQVPSTELENKRILEIIFKSARQRATSAKKIDKAEVRKHKKNNERSRNFLSMFLKEENVKQP